MAMLKNENLQSDSDLSRFCRHLLNNRRILVVSRVETGALEHIVYTCGATSCVCWL